MAEKLLKRTLTPAAAILALAFSRTCFANGIIF